MQVRKRRPAHAGGRCSARRNARRVDGKFERKVREGVRDDTERTAPLCLERRRRKRRRVVKFTKPLAGRDFGHPAEQPLLWPRACQEKAIRTDRDKRRAAT